MAKTSGTDYTLLCGKVKVRLHQVSIESLIKKHRTNGDTSLLTAARLTLLKFLAALLLQKVAVRSSVLSLLVSCCHHLSKLNIPPPIVFVDSIGIAQLYVSCLKIANASHDTVVLQAHWQKYETNVNVFIPVQVLLIVVQKQKTLYIQLADSQSDVRPEVVLFLFRVSTVTFDINFVFFLSCLEVYH